MLGRRPANTFGLSLASERDAWARHFAGAFDNAVIGMSLCSTDGRMLTVNRACCEFLGYSQSELLALDLQQTLAPDDLDETTRLLALLLSGEQDSWRRETRLRHRRGELVWGELTCTLARDHDGQPLFLIAQLQDITERKRAEQALRESEERLRSLAALSSDWYWEQDEQFRFVRFISNDATPPWRTDRQELLGLQRWELPGLVPLKGTWEEHRATIQAHRSFRNFEYVDLQDPLAPRYMSVSGEPIFDSDRRCIGYRGTARDIGESMLAQRRLRDTQAMLDLAAQVGRLGAWAWDVGAPALRWSQEACAIFEVKPGFAPTPQQAMRFIAPAYRATIRSTLRACLQGGSPFDIEVQIITARGHPLWIRFICEAEWDANGRVRRLQGALQDISGSKRAQQEIMRLNAELEVRVKERTSQLEAANRELEAFSYSIAHDLRAPLSSIDGFSNALWESLGDSLEARSAHYLRRIRAGVRQMSDLTDGLLSLASLSRADLRSEKIDLAELARSAAAACGERSPERQVDLVIADSLPGEGDPRLLAQVMGNLIGNAWKFTSRKARARIEVGGVQGPDGHWMYHVRDDGAGFDMAYASKMFEAFRRMHSTAEFEGTGIGLAIADRIITRHGGRIWAESAPDQGATFYFTLGGATG